MYPSFFSNTHPRLNFYYLAQPSEKTLHESHLFLSQYYPRTEQEWTKMAIKEVHSAETLHVSWQKESQNALQALSDEREPLQVRPNHLCKSVVPLRKTSFPPPLPVRLQIIQLGLRD